MTPALAALALLAATASPVVEPIFAPQDKHVHGSAIAELPNGDLFAVWFHGSGERTADDVVVQGARKPAGADTWSHVFITADTPGHPDCNPVVYVDDAGQLWLYWIVVRAHAWEQSLLQYRRTANFSGDAAIAWDWQGVVHLKPGEKFAARIESAFDEIEYPEPMWATFAQPYVRQLRAAAQVPAKRQIGWMTRARPLTLESGRLLLPLYSDGFNVSLVAYTDDGGDTWTASEPIVGLGNVQPSLAQREDGTVVALMRDNGVPPKRMIHSESSDGGETWTVGRDIPLNNPGASVALLALQDGRWLLAYNDTEEGRHDLSLAISKDEGETWEKLGALAHGPGGTEFHYPFAMQGDAGTVHLSFTHRSPAGKTIYHVACTEEDLQPGLQAFEDAPGLRYAP